MKTTLLICLLSVSFSACGKPEPIFEISFPKTKPNAASYRLSKNFKTKEAENLFFRAGKQAGLSVQRTRGSGL